MVKNHLEKYLVLKNDATTQFCLIVPKNDMCVVVNGELKETAEIEVKGYGNEGESLKEANRLFLAKLKQGYQEESKPEGMSVFSVAIEQLKTEDAKQFEIKLLVLGMLVEAYYTRGGHPFTQFLGVKMKDEQLVDTPILDEYLQKHLHALSSESLVGVFQMTLQDIYFNFKATGLVVEEIIKRKDKDAQLAIVNQFYEACEYYDAGHRFWSSTNQDHLIDTYFPQFESEALLKLLERAPGDMLTGDGGDSMDELFAPALHHTEDVNLQQNILEVLNKYKKEYEEEEYVDEEYFETLLEEILESASPSVVQGIEQIKEGKKKKEALLKAIEENSLITIEELINQEVLPDTNVITKVIEKTLEGGDLSILKMFKNKQIDIDVEELFKNAEEHIDTLIECIELDLIDIGYTNKKTNKNLLFYVSENIALLEVLLKKGVDVNHTDTAGNTILARVCSYAKGDNEKDINVVQLLLQHNANPNNPLTEEGWQKGMTPLHFAVKNEAIEITKLLIAASADVNTIAGNDKNPLMLAHQVDNNILIDILTQANATAPEKELRKIKFMNCASNQQWDELIEMEEKIIADYPKEFVIVLNIAQAYYFSEANYSKSSEYGTNALSIKPCNESLNILIMSKVRLGKFQEAIDVFINHKEKFDPQRSLSHNIVANLIVAYCASNQTEEGIEALEPYFGEITESLKERGTMNFNIACMYALTNNLYEMLPYVIAALERQYTKEEFLNESDFAAYHTNELFLFILNQDHKSTIELEHHKEDPESNTFKKIKLKAYYNTGTFSFENNEHEVSYERGTIGQEKKRIQERLYESKAQALVMYFRKLKEKPPHGKSNYFILKEDTTQEPEIHVYPPENLPEQLDFLCGKKITLSFDKPIEFTTNAKAGDRIADFNTGKIPVVSKQFLDILVDAGVDALQTFPVIIKSKKDATVWKDYFAINLLEVVPCGAFPGSLLKGKKPKWGIRCELAIDTDRVNKEPLFRLQEHLPTIIVYRDVVKQLIDQDPDENMIWEFENIVQ
ncbi:ankyrin repeat domain-containing protein [Aquimarina sediminis]|uniref:ankyrin repeat domain-containing protein n=1 Tax=Aquimarina sediminis TaxID=2070536 RepID=UPI000CA006BB|nr:ankyrin repeat domain-containing protein [Aquimarina sediminis]